MFINTLKKTISILLLTTLLLGRGLFITGELVLAQEPTTSQSQSSGSSVPPPPSNPPPAKEVPPPPSGNTGGSLPPSYTVPTPPSGTNTIPPTIPAVPSTVQPTVSSSGGEASQTTSTPSPGSSTSTESPASTIFPTESQQTNTSESTQTASGANSTASGTESTSGTVNDPANIETGPFSLNQATEVLNQNLEKLNTNLAQVQNKVDAISQTGFNYANLNSLGGNVFSGDATASYNLLNKLNSNITGIGGFQVFNIYGTQFGDINFQLADGNILQAFSTASSNVSKNVNTGPGSNNIADSQNGFIVKEANGNNSVLTNDIVLDAVSGGNSASGNTGNGTVKTGNATALGTILNLVNTNINVSKWMIGVVNVFGTLAGNIILPGSGSSTSIASQQPTVTTQNSATGALSSNQVSYSSDSKATFENNNSADVVSNVDVAANTGNNIASANTGGGSVVSGSSNASVTNSTIANQNTVNQEDTVWMVIVNEAGKWVGHIIGAPWGATSASNALGISQQSGGTGQQTYTTAQNNLTGPGSENSASFTSVSDSVYTNTNDAKIVNNIKANADTGNNAASYNTGKGEIQTGDAKVGLSLTNIANTNIVAKKFVAVFVNVLGSFLGDIVTPSSQNQQNLTTGNGNTNTSATGGNSSGTGTSSTTPSNNFPPTFEAGSIGGLNDSSSSLSSTNSETESESTNSNQIQAVNKNEYVYTTPEYEASFQLASSVKKQVVMKRIYYQNNQKPVTLDAYPSDKLIRGPFISTAFAKATETTFPGILLGGATFRVNESWLSVIPLAFLFILFRRRKQIDIAKYVNTMLDILL